jgi:hypothetical protein
LISSEFPLETFTALMSKHLESFRSLESLQVKALEGMKNQGVEGLADLLQRQQAVYVDIAGQMAEIKPLLNEWEALQPAERERLRQGKPGEILAALEDVAQAIQKRHREMFGGEAPAAAAAEGGAQAADPAKSEGPVDISQRINLYRGLQ